MPAVAGQGPATRPRLLHEIKHDGFRILALRDGSGVRLYTRNGHDFSRRFPLVVAAVATLPVRSCAWWSCFFRLVIETIVRDFVEDETSAGTARLALLFRTLQAQARGQEPGSAGGGARSRGRGR
jgi:hypothetical protein